MPDQNNQPYQPMDNSQIYPEPRAGALNHGNNVIQPADKDPAVEMIRQKIQNLYAEEPDAKEEITEAVHHTHPGSKHQQFMAGLNASGRSIAEIQAAWHSYYIDLPDNEKHEVWQEFYIQNGNTAAAAPGQASQPATLVNPNPLLAQAAQAVPAAPVHQPAQASQITSHAAVHHRVTHRHRAAARAAVSAHREKASAVKKRIIETVKSAAADGGNGKLTHKHHLQSLFFGLGCGAVVIVIFLFSFFNEVIIAPFIQPSRDVNNTPVIVDTASAVITGGTKIIIPKINLEIPVDYSQTTTSEAAIETALDSGIVHYPSTTKPGETGNAAYFGHSSNNIFNPGKYKFAFVLLHELQDGDVFYLNYGDKTYAYKVFSKTIVSPSQVGVLDPIPGHAATATLITCDPPGTSINRLVVVGDQISPDPNTNGAPAEQTATSVSSSTVASEASLPGNGPSLWSRLVNSIF